MEQSGIRTNKESTLSYQKMSKTDIKCSIMNPNIPIKEASMKIEASFISYRLYKFTFKYCFENKEFKYKHKNFKQLRFDGSLFLKDFYLN